MHRTDFTRLNVREFCLDAVRFDFEPYKDIRLPLAGTYQPKNAALAITVLEVLRAINWKISDDDIITGLSNVYWPGRFEVLMKRPVFILDGAQIPTASRRRGQPEPALRRKKIVFLTGVMADKDVRAMMGFIAPLAKALLQWSRIIPAR